MCSSDLRTVVPGGFAAKSGVRPGMLLLGLNGRETMARPLARGDLPNFFRQRPLQCLFARPTLPLCDFANLRAGEFEEGFSTITMQIPRNLDRYLGGDTWLPKDKNIERKIREVVYAIQIERHYSKNEHVLPVFLRPKHPIHLAPRATVRVPHSMSELHSSFAKNARSKSDSDDSETASSELSSKNFGSFH